MQIRKWRHLIKLFVWQQKRRLVLLMAAALALGFVFFLPLSLEATTTEVSLWPPELWYVAMFGLLISAIVVICTD